VAGHVRAQPRHVQVSDTPHASLVGLATQFNMQTL
jgi:hypothetical protein